MLQVRPVSQYILTCGGQPVLNVPVATQLRVTRDPDVT